MTRLKFTPEVIQILRDNFPDNGAKFCQELLGPEFGSLASIMHTAAKNGIKRNRGYEGSNFNVEDFTNVTDPRIAYFLGWAWADGYLAKDKVGRPYGVTFCVRPDDGHEFFEMIKGIGNITKSEYSNEKYHRLFVRLSNSEIARHLDSMDYTLKSTVSPSKILKSIPEHLHPLFWRGFFCGDGCISHGISKKDSVTASLTFAGSYNQDWTDFTDVLTKLNCKFTIDRFIDKNTGHKRSIVIVGIRHDIIHFSKWLYESYDQDLLGLKRKKEKFDFLVDAYNETRLKTLKTRIKQNLDGYYSYTYSRFGFLKKTVYFSSREDAELFHDLIFLFLEGHKCHTFNEYFPPGSFYFQPELNNNLLLKYGDLAVKAMSHPTPRPPKL